MKIRLNIKGILIATVVVLGLIFASSYLSSSNLKGSLNFNDLGSYQKQKYWQYMKDCQTLLSNKEYTQYRTCALNAIQKASTTQQQTAYCTDSDGGIDYLKKGKVTTDLYPNGIDDYAQTFSNGKTYLMEGACTSDNKYIAYQKNCKELGANYELSDGACEDVSPVQISGTINDENNIPVQNATIQLYYTFENSGKVYRIGSTEKQTDSNGGFSMSESEFLPSITQKIGSIQKPYAFFISVIKDGYLDTYIFDGGENSKIISSGSWKVTGILKKVPPRLSQTQGLFSVSYYPGQEQCAQTALNKMAYFYPKIATLLGFQANPSGLKFTFNTSVEQGSGDWTGGFYGISSVCYPWTDNIKSPQIDMMWNDAIPHEFGHVFISHFQDFMPYWTDEGIAQYLNRKVNNSNFSCDSSKFLPVQELTSENMPYYESAACFWKLLEDDHPGFIKNSMSYLQELAAQNVSSTYKYTPETKKFISEVLTKVLVNNYGMTQADAQTYLGAFMTKFKYDPNKS